MHLSSSSVLKEARCWLALVLMSGGVGWAAERPSPPALPAASILARLARSSAYIFSGTVLAVERIPPDGGGSVASVQVTFHVDQGILGIKTGQSLRIREWAGLWESGERYRPGERLLLFLHRPSRLGLTSPVGGALGKFKVDSGGAVVLDPSVLSTGVSPIGFAPGVRDPRPISVLGPLPARTAPLAGKIRFSSQDLARAIRQAGRE